MISFKAQVVSKFWKPLCIGKSGKSGTDCQAISSVLVPNSDGQFVGPIFFFSLIYLFLFIIMLINYSFLFFPADISDIPDDIKHLASLQIADFSSNPIPRLPVGFSKLKSLTVLGLNDMSLTSLPEDFGW